MSAPTATVDAAVHSIALAALPEHPSTAAATASKELFAGLCREHHVEEAGGSCLVSR